MQDPISNIFDMEAFGRQAESALGRCNIDKSLLAEYLNPVQIAKCKWYQYNCKAKTKESNK